MLINHNSIRLILIANIYKQFSSNIGFDGLDGNIDTTYGDEKGYYHDCAMRLKYELENNMVLAQQKRLRKERNPIYIFRTYLEPLFQSQ